MPISGPMGKNRIKRASTFVGTHPENMCAKYQENRLETEAGDRFLVNMAIWAHFKLFVPVSGPMGINHKKRASSLWLLTQRTWIPNIKRMG